MRPMGSVKLVEADEAGQEQAAIIVPVLNEIRRLTPCLDSLIQQGEEVAEILVVDGGSNDGTQELVISYSQKDNRIRLVDASPVPTIWNGKAWGLQVGLQSVQTKASWIVTVDADVRVERPVVKVMLGQAKHERLSVLSVATRQEITGPSEGLLHPSLLTTLVYRFGIPNQIFRHVHEVQANGQCMLFRRDVLTSIRGFEPVRTSICEDVTIARLLVSEGCRVGFYEADSLVRVKMYEDWREMWRNWPRSLMMHDRFAGLNTLMGWLEVFFVQALPFPLLLVLLWKHGLRRERKNVVQRFIAGVPGPNSPAMNRWTTFIWIILNSILIAMRVGVLFGTAQTYERRPWTYWASPLCDMPVALWLAKMVLQRRHTWRGRELVRDDA